MIANVSLPGVDDLLLEGHRLYAVQNFLNQIAEVRLGSHFRSGVVRTWFPPSADRFEVVVVQQLGQVPGIAIDLPKSAFAHLPRAATAPFAWIGSVARSRRPSAAARRRGPGSRALQ